MVPILLFLSICWISLALSYYDEKIHIKSNEISDSTLLSFTFKVESIDENILGYFPSSVSSVVDKYDIDSFVLGIGRGIWDPSRMGSAPKKQFLSSSGLSFNIARSVNFDSNDTIYEWLEEVFPFFGSMTCSSIGGEWHAMGSRELQISTGFAPYREWYIQSDHCDAPIMSDLIVHPNSVCGSIPYIDVCTESLQSLLSLFPCRDTMGLSTLIDPRMVFSSDWSLFRLTFRHQGRGKLELRLELDLSVRNSLWKGKSAVVDEDRNAFRPQLLDVINGTMNPYFVQPSCPLASYSSSVMENYKLHREKAGDVIIDIRRRTSEIRLGVISNLLSIDIYSIAESSIFHGDSCQPSDKLSFTNSYTSNSGGNFDACVIIRVREFLPWFLNIDFPTFSVFLQDRSVTSSINVIQKGHERGQPLILDYYLYIPWNGESSVTAFINYRISTTLLHMEDCAPDTHRGMDIVPAMAWQLLPNSEEDLFPFDTTSVSTIEVVCPDFAMPYNAITLIATIFAFILGLFINGLARERNLGKKLS